MINKITIAFVGGETKPFYKALMLDSSGYVVEYDLLEASHGKLLGLALNLVRLGKRVEIQSGGVFFSSKLSLTVGDTVYLRLTGISQTPLLAKNLGVEELYVILGKAVTSNSFIIDIKEYKFV